MTVGCTVPKGFAVYPPPQQEPFAKPLRQTLLNIFICSRKFGNLVPGFRHAHTTAMCGGQRVTRAVVLHLCLGRQGLLVVYCFMCQASWSLRFWGVYHLCLPSYRKSTGIIDTCYHARLSACSGDPDIGCHTLQKALYPRSHLPAGNASV